MYLIAGTVGGYESESDSGVTPSTCRWTWPTLCPVIRYGSRIYSAAHLRTPRLLRRPSPPPFVVAHLRGEPSFKLPALSRYHEIQPLDKRVKFVLGSRHGSRAFKSRLTLSRRVARSRLPRLAPKISSCDDSTWDYQILNNFNDGACRTLRGISY